MSKQDKQLRQQIHQTIAEPTILIEQRIADALCEQGEFRARIDSSELALILRKVVHTLVGKQKVANFDVPIVHNVTEMNVRITGGEALVACEVHVHQPIIAFIRFKYTLENDPAALGKRLRLKHNRIEVQEITRPLDMGAKLALKMMRVEHIARQELSDPGGIIMRTLPDQLERLGFDGALCDIDLEFNGDGSTLNVYITAE
jgi:hypothetical protein